MGDKVVLKTLKKMARDPEKEHQLVLRLPSVSFFMLRLGNDSRREL